MHSDLNGAVWRKSSYSHEAGQCIEIGHALPGASPVRDSKDPEGPALMFSAEAFASFIAGIKAGDLSRA
ncbi:DUF397 domain-containing protein [Kitasatospora sp. NPDC058965]|uniref:DUF397 domain-containing protein n=1 Tax=Kitasatospora sp. NPDC058965 TaxID=3346682 RepID=UPI0036A87475